jgi:superfamily I DNA/RNA helicase
MKRRPNELGEALLKAIGVDPTKCQAITFTSDAQNAMETAVITMTVVNPETGEIEAWTETWAPLNAQRRDPA